MSTFIPFLLLAKTPLLALADPGSTMNLLALRATIARRNRRLRHCAERFLYEALVVGA
jgi:hypothetical protein